MSVWLQERPSGQHVPLDAEDGMRLFEDSALTAVFGPEAVVKDSCCQPEPVDHWVIALDDLFLARQGFGLVLAAALY